MKYLIKLSYDGYDYAGIQAQKEKRTIQGEFLKAFNKIYPNKSIIYASRTDAKVHAYGQIIQFDVDDKVSDNFLRSLNSLLPENIKATKLIAVSDQFHCQKDVVYKHYQYRISFDNNDVFNKRYSTYSYYALDKELFKKALNKYLGKHDFTSFNTTPLSIKSNQVKEIFRIDFKEVDNLWIIDFYGDGFLRYMIRILIGVAMLIARNKMDLKMIDKMFEEKHKNHYKYVAPACGLFLMEVFYDKLREDA